MGDFCKASFQPMGNWQVHFHLGYHHFKFRYVLCHDGLIYKSPHLINVISKSKPLLSNHVQDGMEI
jgi:hypothetical protein